MKKRMKIRLKCNKLKKLKRQLHEPHLYDFKTLIQSFVFIFYFFVK